MKSLRVLDLFSGIGGFSLGLERSGGFRTVAFCEIEDYPRRILKRRWPGVSVRSDIREIEGEYRGSVEVVCGGFPCQPFSTAAAGKNPKDTLSGEFVRVICETAPKYVIGENTERKAFSATTIRAIEGIGRSVYPMYIPASQAGAPHDRGRWWLVAYPHDNGELPRALDAEASKLQEVFGSVWGAENYARAVRVPDGLPHRMDRLRVLGNAVIPQIPEAIGRAIMSVEGAG